MADADLSAVQEAVRRVLRTPLRPPLRPPDCLLVPTSRGAGERQAPRIPPSVEANPAAVRTPDPPGNVAENIFDFMISEMDSTQPVPLMYYSFFSSNYLD